uniref:Uncharacterized protein n=1 Tax=Chlamydomonas leiostraca TaxID=1034604 RepID=A0A7S0R3Q1_9CHLO|eukprot:CAMPEP_0202867186 /NCGR_PEP_ID=MMETSP1391-20130828/8873_1 /ASSEMBLY_ACC=CAM_ASM_000867 /TAXON_ID=1034604 /ORGANISM="Chlamydomonas leiostraca, Strain SAG 11-49" /LENGTH=214 /DNA_ID=CAMNT_0049547201 /DNA_START=79 /DNA_END=723 /DNA_ORIENTATION=+
MALRAAGSRFMAALAAPRMPGFAAMATSNSSNQTEEVVTPYVYQSPGSSLREPSLGTGHSLGNPTYEYDPKPPRISLSDPQNFPINTRQQRRQKEEDQVRAAVEAAQKAQADGGKKKKSSVVEPSYVYASPGSSISSPSYGISLSDPVVLTDPSPAALSTPDVATEREATNAATNTRERKGLRPDDYAQAPYVTSTKGSMKEPHYVSVTDPQDK